MDLVWIAQLVLLPIQLGWGLLYWKTGRFYSRRTIDVVAVVLALSVWLIAILVGGPASLDHGRIWAVVFTTTAGFLGFNAILGVAAILRHRATTAGGEQSPDRQRAAG